MLDLVFVVLAYLSLLLRCLGSSGSFSGAVNGTFDVAIIMIRLQPILKENLLRGRGSGPRSKLQVHIAQPEKAEPRGRPRAVSRIFDLQEGSSRRAQRGSRLDDRYPFYLPFERRRTCPDLACPSLSLSFPSHHAGFGLFLLVFEACCHGANKVGALSMGTERVDPGLNIAL